MLRGIDRHLELDGLRTQLKPFYGASERPLVVPELIMRMLIIGYSVGLRSERRLLPWWSYSRSAMKALLPETPLRAKIHGAR
jgi:hypothetical protein